MKTQLRKILLSERNTLNTLYKKNATSELLTILENTSFFKNAKKIFIYIGFGSEIDTKDFIKKHIDKKEIFVPKIEKDEMKLIRLRYWEELKPGSFGILEPITNNHYEEEIDLVITPAIAFDKKGYRLGYGKGYYDRYFKNKKYKLSIGLTYHKLLQNNIPVEPHDKKVDLILTERGILDLNEKNNSNN